MTKVLCALLALFLAGCGISDYTPVVDPYDSNYSRFARDLAHCNQIVDDKDNSDLIGSNMLDGFLSGVISGAITGALSGRTIDGMIASGALGIVQGMFSGKTQAEAARQAIMHNCMEAWGHRVYY